MKSSNKKSNKNITENLTKQLKQIFNDPQDPSGSYTGTCSYGDNKPEQDADDL